MSATLRPYTIGGLPRPSGLLLPSRSTRNRTLSLPQARGLGGRNNLKLVNPKTSHGHGIVNGAANGRQGVFDREKDYELREEKDRIEEFLTKISHTGILHQETTRFRRYLCVVAKDSVRLVSTIMGQPGAFPQDGLLTTLMTPTKRDKLVLQVYLRIFVATAEASYNDKVTKETIVSFLGALEGVAAMSYFMARDTLAKFDDDKSSSPKRDQNTEVDETRREYVVKMDSLKHELSTVPPYNTIKILYDTVKNAKRSTELFVISMTVCRRKVLRHITQVTQGGQQSDAKPFFREPVFGEYAWPPEFFWGLQV